MLQSPQPMLSARMKTTLGLPCGVLSILASFALSCEGALAVSAKARPNEVAFFVLMALLRCNTFRQLPYCWGGFGFGIGSVQLPPKTIVLPFVWALALISS